MFDSYTVDGDGGGIRAEVIAYDVLCLLSILSILAAFSKTRLKNLLAEDPLSKRLVVLCVFSLAYEYKFRLGRRISHFQFLREYGYTLVSISQLAHFVALAAVAMDAVCWTVSERRARLRLNPKMAWFTSWIAWTAITSLSIATVCYLQFYRREAAKIFLPKQLAELSSIPLALLFFVVLIFWRATAIAAATKANRYRRKDRVTETILYIYVRMIAVAFAISCSRVILVMVKTDWTVIHFIHALDGCFFASIAYKLEPPYVSDGVTTVASEASVNRLVTLDSSSDLQLQQV